MFSRFRLAFVVLCALPLTSSAQTRSVWSDQSFPAAIANSGERRITPEQVRYVTLDMATLRSQLAQAATGTVLDRRSATTTISLPTPTGGAADFRVLEVSIMHPDLQAQFPNIRTYSGVGVDDVGTTVKLDITEHGFHAMVMPPTREAWFIDPLFVGNTTNYQVYEKKNFVKTHTTEFLGCGYDQVNDLDAAALQTRQWIEQMGVDRVGDCQLRTYRLALACTGEYAAFHGGTTGGVMSAMTTTMNRVNDMFERDATLTMVLVANNSSLIFLDAGTDPFSNGDGSAMLGENQTTCTNVIGGANYDIGHVFSTGGGGIASLNSPCSSSRKAQGVTGQSNPVGDPFDIDYVAHEMGHQYGGNHTQNNSCNRASTAAVEVGSGVTIMGYAGICAPNPLNNSIAMFGGYSMQEIAANVTSGTSSTCPATTTIIGETAPTVSAGVDRTIPRSTPFVLTAIGSDAQTSQTLTYSWEQMDNAVATMPPVATNTGGPAWVPKLPTTSPVRWMPNLDDVIANNSPTWEVLSSVGRTYNFRVTVRDNLDNGACNDQDNMVVTVASNSGPFLVTQPNTAVSWPALSSQTITWDVANTTASPVSCANVNILLSTDGGQTFPTTLLANTPNDGTQTVTLSNSPSTTARIKIEGANNIFYDMSNTNFTITAAPSGVLLSAKAFLQGPYATSLMSDGLRTASLIPTTEPYTALLFNHVGGGGETTSSGILAVTGNDAIVDWVLLELRSGSNSAQVIATRSALIQRDGDIVDVDGVSPVSFPVATANYYVAVRHRNHLACMAAAPVSLSATTTSLDFSTVTTFGTEAQLVLGGKNVLWAGNVVVDDEVLYTGQGNDRDPILTLIGGVVPTNTAAGYHLEDVNMDGVARYTGTNNDRDIILENIGGTVPTNSRAEQLP